MRPITQPPGASLLEPVAVNQALLETHLLVSVARDAMSTASLLPECINVKPSLGHTTYEKSLSA